MSVIIFKACLPGHGKLFSFANNETIKIKEMERMKY